MNARWKGRKLEGIFWHLKGTWDTFTWYYKSSMDGGNGGLVKLSWLFYFWHIYKSFCIWLIHPVVQTNGSSLSSWGSILFKISICSMFSLSRRWHLNEWPDLVILLPNLREFGNKKSLNLVTPWPEIGTSRGLWRDVRRVSRISSASPQAYERRTFYAYKFQQIWSQTSERRPQSFDRDPWWQSEQFLYKFYQKCS